jgi:hypothetical protein
MTILKLPALASAKRVASIHFKTTNVPARHDDIVHVVVGVTFC